MDDALRTIRPPRNAQERWLLKQAFRQGPAGGHSIRRLLNNLGLDRGLVDRVVALAARNVAEGFCPLHEEPLKRDGEWGRCQRCVEEDGKKRPVRYRIGHQESAP